MGQWVEVGGETVRIGRRVLEEMGGVVMVAFLGEGAGFVGCEERETVFWGELGGSRGEGLAEVGGRPDIRGGGRSRPSTALRESWWAKSEACHHSRNLRAKMEVGRRILRLERRRRYAFVKRMRGLKMPFVWPGRVPGPAAFGGGSAARAIAW